MARDRPPGREKAPARPAHPRPGAPSPRRTEGRAHAGEPAAAGLRGLPLFLFMCTVALLVTRLAMMLSQPLASEDAYITFRYARMTAAGQGLVYNAGERVMGYTSLPWMLWCALGTLL